MFSAAPVIKTEKSKKKNKTKTTTAIVNSSVVVSSTTPAKKGKPLCIGSVKIKGRVVHQLFPRLPIIAGTPDHSFGIFKMKVVEVLSGSSLVSKDEEIVIKGNIYSPLERNIYYTITAEKQEDPSWGMQYIIKTVHREVDFSKRENMETFLKSILTSKQVENIYEAYEDPYPIFRDHDVKALIKVNGIGVTYASKIIDKFHENKDYARLKISLKDYDFTDKMLKKLRSVYGDDSRVETIVTKFPYNLVDDIEGIGFKKGDAIARISGISEKSVERIKAYVKFYLKHECEENGNSYVISSELDQHMYYELGGKDNILVYYYDDDGNIVGSNIRQAMEELTEGDDSVVIIENNINKRNRRIYLRRIWNLENEIALNLERLSTAHNDIYNDDWEDKIKELEEKQGFPFSPEQIEGIRMGIEKPVCMVAGLAGSGKSSLVSGILAGLHDFTFAQCALSGKAAARLQEVTGQTGMTIHRMLGYGDPSLEGEKDYVYDETNPLPYDIIILDEISLVGGDIFLDLIKAIKTGTKLIMIGDLGQLEAIGTLNLAADLSNSVKIPSVELKTIHRQAAQSGIVTTAREIRDCRPVNNITDEGKYIMGELKDMEFDLRMDSGFTRDMVCDSFEELYNSPLVNKNIMDIQVISPVKERGDACVCNLNNDIQEIVNPVNDDDCIESKNYRIHVGDKVMCVKNNYNCLSNKGLINPIYNGWVGIVEKIDRNENEITINFPLALNGLVVLSISEATDYLVLGYVSTVHKLQGSSAKAVIGAIDYSTPPKMLSCELLYTLITRAEKYCVLAGQSGAIVQATLNDPIPNKRTFLPELLEKYL